METLLYGLAAVGGLTLLCFGLAGGAGMATEKGPLAWPLGFLLGVFVSAGAAIVFVGIPLAVLWAVGRAVQAMLWATTSGAS